MAVRDVGGEPRDEARLMGLGMRLRNTLRGKALNRDLDEELQSHVDEAVADGRASREASRSLGRRLQLREEARDALTVVWLDSFARDARVACRRLGKHKTVTAVAILSLALAMGACLSAYQLVNGLFLRVLPVSEPRGLYVLATEDRDVDHQTFDNDFFDYPGFVAVQKTLVGKAEVAAADSPSRTDAVIGGDESERVYLQYVSGNFFAVLGVRPQLGEWPALDSESEGTISDDYWTRRFGRDPKVLGKVVHLGAKAVAISAVAPPRFSGTDPGTSTDLFVPATLNGAYRRLDASWVRLWIRPNQGARVEDVASSAISTLRAHRVEQVSSWGPGYAPSEATEFVDARAYLLHASTGRSYAQRNYGRALTILAVLVALVLLVACFNVSNLMAAQASVRARETAVRVSLGAGRWRLLQATIVESVWMACAASLLGVLFAGWAAPFVARTLEQPDRPVSFAFELDLRFAASASVLTLCAALLFALAPALSRSGTDPYSELKGAAEDRAKRRLASVLVGSQAALCLLVCLAAALFVSTFEKLARQPLGFSADRVLTLESHGATGRPVTAWLQAAERLRATPGVESAAISAVPLMYGAWGSHTIFLEDGRTLDRGRSSWFLDISPGWFDTMKVRMIEGRDFIASDGATSAIVNESFARGYFPAQDAVGKTFAFDDRRERVTARIVGLVQDARYTGMRGPIPATVYIPLRGSVDWSTFEVRTKTADPLALGAALRREVSSTSPGIYVSTVVSQEDRVRSQTVRERMLAELAGFFAAVALALAGIGLYGTLSYDVARRKKELGIRLALGSRLGAIARRVGLGTFSAVGAGAIVGLGAGLAAERYVVSLLYEVRAADPTMLAPPIVVMALAASLAAVRPLLRATRIDPAQLLRSE